jgi:4'-phosphopantetheinyl transferase EntD
MGGDVAPSELSEGATERILTALRDIRPTLGGIGFGLASKWDQTHADWHPSEYRLASEMPGKRREEFLGGRTAVRRALADAHLPVPDEPILIGDAGGPAMPDGVAVSISHSRGITVAVAAPAEEFSSVGVDVELCESPEEPARQVLSAAEQAWLLDGYAGPERDRRLLDAFSAKESACKALDRQLVEGSLRRIHLIPFAGSFIAWPRDRRDIRLRVWVRRIGPGVLTWTTVPSGASC